MRKLWFLLIILPLCNSTYVSNCTTISNSGIYELNQNLYGAPLNVEYGIFAFSNYNYCLRINTSDVILDCRNYSISSTRKLNDFFGVVVQGSNDTLGNGSISNITIRNCNINGYQTSIFLGQANHSIIDNINSREEAYGVLIYRSDFVNISNSQVVNASKAGFHMFDSPGNIIFFNNTVLYGLPNRRVNNQNVIFFLYGYYVVGKNISILHNSAINTTREGFHLENVSDVEIRSNLAENNAGNGFTILNADNVSFELNLLKNNDVSILEGTNFRIMENIFSSGLFVDKSSFVNITSNLINFSRGDGFGVFESSFFNIKNTSVINSSYSGLVILFSSNINIKDSNYCYNKYYPDSAFSQILDFEYVNSSDIKLVNITCDHSYPEGLCSNSCPIIEPPHPTNEVEQSSCPLSVFGVIALLVFVRKTQETSK